jgi:hypothetical protein
MANHKTGHLHAWALLLSASLLFFSILGPFDDDRRCGLLLGVNGSRGLANLV